MSHTIRDPKDISPPLGRYSHGVEVAPNARWLYISGQVGISPDGVYADGIEAQSEQAWRNLEAILAEAGMGLEDLVRINAFITDSRFVAGFREGRDKVLGADVPPPASTLLVVTALADPRMLIEVEAVAAKAP